MSFEMRSEQNEKDHRPSLKVQALYLHFPFCRHLCNYCDFFKKVPSSPQEVRDFETRLETAFEIHADLMREAGAEWAELETVYVGGGTPSLWGHEGAAFLERFLSQRGLRLAPGVEFTIEVNPGGHAPGALQAFRQAGVNRFSVGLQSLDPDLLKALDRVHSPQEGLETLALLQDMQANYSVDFMLGLPASQGKREVLKELEKVLSYGPSHLSLYILTTKSNYVRINELPSEDWVAQEYDQVSAYLRSRGYLHYEVSNFCLPGMESRHNMRYWRGETTAALGPSATGLLAWPDQAWRYKWKASGVEYDRELLGPSELRLEKLYLSLRTHEGLDYISFWKTPENILRFEELLTDWKRRDLAYSESPSGRACLTPSGYLLMDGLLNEVFTAFETI